MWSAACTDTKISDDQAGNSNESQSNASILALPWGTLRYRRQLRGCCPALPPLLSALLETKNVPLHSITIDYAVSLVPCRSIHWD